MNVIAAASIRSYNGRIEDVEEMLGYEESYSDGQNLNLIFDRTLQTEATD
jgi:hypothetical protein